MMRRLTDIDIKYLKGVGPKRADTLGKELDIHTYYDLLHYFPSRYDDRSKVLKIKDVASEREQGEECKGCLVMEQEHSMWYGLIV